MKNIVIKKAGKKGRGIFAAKDFKKDEIIAHIDGEVVETDDPTTLSKEFQDHCFPFEKRGNKYRYVVPGFPHGNINHSCEPNAGIKNNRDFVAMQPIKKGEEICFDYTMNNIDDWIMKCSCGSKNCRKVISNFAALDDKIKKKYLEYIIDCIREEYLKNK